MRNRRNPARFQDYIPTSTVPTQLGRYLTKKQRQEAAKARVDAAQPKCDPEPSLDGGTCEENDPVTHQITTNSDSFGVFRKYSSLSSHNPNDIDPFIDVPSISPSSIPASRPPDTELIGSNLTISPSAGIPSDPLAHSENPTVDLLLSWYSEGSTDGATSLDRLVDCIRDPLFDISQLEGFTAVNALRRFEREHLSSNALKPGDGWKCGKVTIRVPCTGHKQCEEDAPEFTVDGIYYRDIVEIITMELKDPDSFENIHIRPFEEWWKPTEASDPIRVYSEVYTSDAMLQLEKGLEETLKTTAGPQLETFVLSALLYSDSTNLAQFGHASLWPVYMFIGNASKYLRAQPNSFSAHHLAYLPTVRDLYSPFNHISQFTQLPDSIKEFYFKHYGIYPNADMLAHLKRELIHGALRLILGGTCSDAKKNGWTTLCADEVLRRWFLEIIFHSADYIEK